MGTQEKSDYFKDFGNLSEEEGQQLVIGTLAGAPGTWKECNISPDPMQVKKLSVYHYWIEDE